MRELHRIKIKKHTVLSFKEIQAYLFIVYGAIAIIYKNSNQKHLQSGIQTKDIERKYRTEKWEIKKELVNEQIRERNNFGFLSKPWSRDILKKWTDRENLVTQ